MNELSDTPPSIRGARIGRYFLQVCVIPAAVLLLLPTTASSQEIAYTESGKKISLNPDGTWSPVETTGIAPEIAEAEAVLKGFLAAPTIEDRMRFVLDPEKSKELLEAEFTQAGPVRYRQINTIKNGSKDLQRFSIDAERYVKSWRSDVYVVKSSSGYKVDWRSTVGYTRKAGAYLIEKSTTPLKVRTIGRLKTSVSGSYSVPEGKFIAVSIEVAEKIIRAHIEKSSSDGKKLLEALGDGEEHRLVLEIRHRSKSEQDAAYKAVYGNRYQPGALSYDDGYLLITKVVSIDSWIGGE